MTHAGKKCEFERFALMLWQHTQSPMQEMTEIGARNFVPRRMRIDRAARRLLINMLLITFLRAAVGLLTAKAIDRTSARERHDPTEQLAGFWRVMIRLVPNLQQN